MYFNLLFQALDGFLMILDHMGTVLYVSDDSAEYINLTPVSLCLTARTITLLLFNATEEMVIGIS